MGDIEDEKGGASLYQRALAIYNEGSDEWCIPNRGTKAWAKLEAIRDSLTTRSKPKGATAKRATAKRATAKRATAKRATAKWATAKRNVVKPSAKASDAPLREALANLATKRNRVISIPRTIVGRTDEPTKGEVGTDKHDAGLAKLEAKLDKALTTATDAAALATTTATATASDAKLKKLTRKLKDATAATTAAANAVATAPAMTTATASDSERKLLKLANKLKLATDTAAAASIANNATADAKLSKLVADLRVANAQAAASASAADAKLIRLTAQLEQATRAALSTLPQTPERQSALSRVGQLAATITLATATTVASGVGSIAGAVGRKAVEYAAAKVAPTVALIPPLVVPTDIQATPATPAITAEIPEPKRSVKVARAKQEVSRPTVRAPRIPREPPAREAPPPPIPERQPPAPPSPKRSAEAETVKPPSPKVSPKRSPKRSGEPKRSVKAPSESPIPEGKQEARDIVPLVVLPDIVIKNKGFIDAARELAGFDIESMGRPLLNQRKKSALDGAFKQYKFNWKEASGKYHAERKLVSRADMNKLTKHADIADITLRAKQNIELFGKEGRNIRSRVEAWMSSPAVVGTPSGQSASEATEPEFEESAIIGSETEAPQSAPLESLDISGISSPLSSTPTSTQSTPSRTSRTSRVDESRDIPDDQLARMEGIDIIGQGWEPLTPEEFVIQQMRRAVYGN